MIRTSRLSAVQKDILMLLVKRGHALSSNDVRMELRKRFIGIMTTNALRDLGYIRWTDQGWLATEQGRLRVQEENTRVV